MGKLFSTRESVATPVSVNAHGLENEYPALLSHRAGI